MKRAGLLILLLITFVLQGCAQLSVSHLDKRPWIAEAPQTIHMRFWRFEFMNMPLKEGVGLQGMAYPNTELFPDWARWYDQLAFTVYLSESSGTVVSSAQLDVLPRELGKEPAIPFEFRLPSGGADTPLYVSFGYRMVLAETPWKPGARQEGRIYFAHEGALSR
ncbi:hypothetical protein [Desulfovibrio psychrotolerans]|uniref:Lipoprotein n=1 Tax=Desulfovibrio psychrotolerans TaxID=415242 RepID=A0A7J0BSM2_9BACT|nr:hypothetical protein [Desulfovibrio psychrotolerans]GFM36690.1 hypothetical protein DSM19430T_13740 [Desulfovibrio psychrotolerans]